MKIFDEIKNFFGGFLVMLVIAIVVVGIGILAGWIFKSELVGILTVGGIIVGWALWGAAKELWAWYTKTGVYEEDDKEE